MTNLSPMAALSPDSARAALLVAITDRLDRLEAITPEAAEPGIEAQMTVVKLMAETVLDLAALSPDILDTEVGEFLKTTLRLAAASQATADIADAVRHFAAWANGALLIEDALATLAEPEA